MHRILLYSFVWLKLFEVDQKHLIQLEGASTTPEERWTKLDKLDQSRIETEQSRTGPLAVVIIWQLISELTLGCQELISALKPGCQIAHLFTVRKVGEIIRL